MEVKDSVFIVNRFAITFDCMPNENTMMVIFYKDFTNKTYELFSSYDEETIRKVYFTLLQIENNIQTIKEKYSDIAIHFEHNPLVAKNKKLKGDR